MTKVRASLGFEPAEPVTKINPSEWQPRPKRRSLPASQKEQVRKSAEEVGFRDREPVKQKRGRPKTGRDISRSIKVSVECSELMDEVYEQMNDGSRITIPMGEIVLQAFEALEEKLVKG